MGWLFSKHETTPAPEDDHYWEQFTPPQNLGDIEQVLERSHEYYVSQRGQEYYCGLCGCLMPLSHFPH